MMSLLAVFGVKLSSSAIGKRLSHLTNGSITFSILSIIDFLSERCLNLDDYSAGLYKDNYRAKNILQKYKASPYLSS
jgi:hypothetical protein